MKPSSWMTVLILMTPRELGCLEDRFHGLTAPLSIAALKKY
jgi:hypothetical protein